MADRASATTRTISKVVAGFVDDPDQVTDAVRQQVADCRDCHALAADLGWLAAATTTLAAPARPRDFRLTPADAARLTVGPGNRRPSPVVSVSR